jgi:putative oxidoreductase
LNRIARVLLCLVFIQAVIGKLLGFAGVAGMIAAKGLPLAPLLLVAAMALMAVGSAMVISGWMARLGVILLLVFLIPTTLLFHGDVADSAQRHGRRDQLPSPKCSGDGDSGSGATDHRLAGHQRFGDATEALTGESILFQIGLG